MPDNDLFRRSLDAGMAFTQLTRKRAESIVRDWVKNGEISRDQAAARVDELLERSRQNTDAMLAIVRKEIDERLATLNLVTRDDLAHLASRLGLPARPDRGATPAPSASTPQARPERAPASGAAKAGPRPAKRKATDAPKPATAGSKPATAGSTPATAVSKPATAVSKPATAPAPRVGAKVAKAGAPGKQPGPAPTSTPPAPQA